MFNLGFLMIFSICNVILPYPLKEFFFFFFFWQINLKIARN